MNQRLYRSPDDRILAGVAGGIAETYEIDPALVRVGWAFLIIVTGGVFLLLYIVMAVAVPLRPTQAPLWAATNAYAAPPVGPDGMPAATPPGPDPTGSPMSANVPFASAPYRTPRRENRDSTGAVVFGVILIGVGVFFLARQFIPTLDWGLIWPLIVVFGGVLLIAGAMNRPRRTL